MTDSVDEPRVLTKGANVALRDLDAELGALTVCLDSRGDRGRLVDADVSVLLLAADGKVRSADDFIFYNNPIALGGAVHLRDKLRPDPGTDEADEGWSSDIVTLNLDDVPDDVERIVVSASLDPGAGLTFGDAADIRMRIQRTADARDLLVFDIVDAKAELALLFGEFYRRDAGWKVRAIGQGYVEGLGAIVVAHGVELAEEAADSDPEAATETTPEAEPDGAAGPQVTDAPPVSPSSSRGVSVSRPKRAPRLPAAWDASIPASDGNDWQPARLFPVAGIGGGEEQERRATSALLAVMDIVREFGQALATKAGAPRGALTTYIEVPFGQDEEAYRPDGVVRVTRGQREWTALVEVKTSAGKLDATQIDHYVEIARSREYDAVITISNELTGVDGDHPVSIDRRKLRKVALVHLSWDQIRAEALLTARHRGVADPTQRHVLEEFIRYMTHARSGLAGLADMGPSWVKVRESVKAKTARPGDRGTGEVSARFDELVEHLAYHFSALLGVDVRALPSRETPDHASRRQQLADSGLLFGRLKVPGAVDVIVISADLRADRVTASITVPAPRGETRPTTRINWLLRQLPSDATDSIRVEARLGGGSRAGSTVGLLGKLRSEPTLLVPQDQREIRSFTISLDLPMGAKRAAGTGTLIASVKGVTTTFYADVVQHLRPWADKD